MTTKPHLSPTSIQMYLKCGLQYEFRYVKGIKAPPGIAVIKGKSIHKTAEANYRQKIESHLDMTIPLLQEVASASFEDELKNDFVLSPEEKEKGEKNVIGEQKDKTVLLAGAYGSMVAPLYQPLYVEEPVQIELPKAPFDLLGYLDLADNRDQVRDLKTASRKKQMNDADTSIQLTYYSIAYKKKTGREPSSVGLDVLVDTKEPQLQQLITGRDENDMKSFVHTVNKVMDGIKKEVFLPATPGSWQCSEKFCGYWHSCPAINSKKRGR
jgi:hypothetical protein